jgi:Transglycosylase-like domain
MSAVPIPGPFTPVWVNGHLCGHGCIAETTPCVIPAYICAREARFIDQYNPTENASGKYQFERGTWNGFGGYTNAADAPEGVQDEKAREVWNGGLGCGHWSAC